MKYREHRGGLEESMKTVKEFSTQSEFLAHITKTIYYLKGPIKVEKYGGIDTRIGWDTYIVTVGGNAVGMTDGPLTSLPIRGLDENEPS
jgi:hypothetical protein